MYAYLLFEPRIANGGRVNQRSFGRPHRDERMSVVVAVALPISAAVAPPTLHESSTARHRARLVWVSSLTIILLVFISLKKVKLSIFTLRIYTTTKPATSRSKFSSIYGQRDCCLSERTWGENGEERRGERRGGAQQLLLSDSRSSLRSYRRGLF